MSLEDVKKRFVEEVKLRAYDDRYIDKNEEREILQIAIQQGITVDSARAALAQVCDANEYVLETRVVSQIKDLIDTFANNDGKIDEKEFHDAVTTCKKACKGKRNDIQCKKMVVEVIEENQFKTSKGWFSSWYDAVKKDVGMA
jgi:DNA-directed RNA polymerase beta subunit